MTNRARSGILFQIACTAGLLGIFPGSITRVHAESAHAADTTASAPVAASAAESLFTAIRPVLAHAYAGIDTAALLSRIQERQKWGERDERLIEAEGILHWDMGNPRLAVPCFKRLSRPGAVSMGMLAEGLLAAGERYEAAEWFLKSARATDQTDPMAVSMFRNYLSVKPGDVQAELQSALCLEKQGHDREAAEVYLKHGNRIAENPETAQRVGAMLSSLGKADAAARLYRQAREKHPEVKGLSVGLAKAEESLEHGIEAAAAWTDAWALDGADSIARNRAIALLEKAGDPGKEPLRMLLEKALAHDGTAALHFKLAVLLLDAQDRKAAYPHLESALTASPDNPAYLARLPEAIEGDSLILRNFPVLERKYETEGASLQLALLVARGYSLRDEKANACRAWEQINSLSPRHLEGRRDAFLDLIGCGDPASLTAAFSIGTRRLDMAFDRETALPMMRVSLRLGDYPRASGIAARLVRESPQDAPLILDAAKALLAADRKADARPVLAAIGESAPLPEAGMLLGRMYLEDKDFARGAVQFAIAGDSFPEAIRLRGDCLAETGDFAGAAAEYAAHYDRLGDQESLRALAGMYGRMKSCPKESEALQLLVSRKWADDEDKLRLANLTAGQGDETEAMRIYDALLTPKSVLPAGAAWSEAAIAAGIRFARDGKLEKAIHALNLGLKNPPPSLKPEARAEAWNRLGECLIEKKMWRGAVTAYAAALTADSLSGEAAAELLAAARQAGAKREMEIAYRAVYRLDTLNEEANAFLASERRASRDYKAAAMHFRRVADNHPKDAKAWEDLGNALAMVPDLTAARGPLQTAIDLGAQSDEVYINRARAYRKEGAEDMAASIMDFLLERNAHDYLAILWSAKFAEEDGKQNIALEMFRKSARLSAPRTPWPELANQGVMEAKASLPTD